MEIRLELGQTWKRARELKLGDYVIGRGLVAKLSNSDRGTSNDKEAPQEWRIVVSYDGVKRPDRWHPEAQLETYR